MKQCTAMADAGLRRLLSKKAILPNNAWCHFIVEFMVSNAVAVGSFHR